MPEERRTRVRSEREQKIAIVTLLPPPLLWNVSTALSHILWPFFFFLQYFAVVCAVRKCHSLGP